MRRHDLELDSSEETSRTQETIQKPVHAVEPKLDSPSVAPMAEYRVVIADDHHLIRSVVVGRIYAPKPTHLNPSKPLALVQFSLSRWMVSQPLKRTSRRTEYGGFPDVE
jgi:hypothetical protein